MKMKTWRFTTKLFLCFVATILVSIVAITASFLRESVHGMHSLGESALISSHTAVYDALEMYRRKTEGKLTGDLTAFEGILKPNNRAPMLADDEDRLAKQTLVDQATGEKMIQAIPKIQAGFVFLNGYLKVVEDVKARTGDVLATIFLLYKDKLIRISTTAKTADGNPDLYSYLSSTEKVYQAIVKGENFYGREFTESNWLFTGYKPLVDIDGKIIGAICVGTPMISEEVTTYVSGTKVTNGLGDFFLFNGEGGEYLIHNDNSSDNLYTSIPEFRGVHNGSMTYMRNGHEMVAFIKPLDRWGAVLGVSMDRNDLLGGLDRKLVLYSSGLGGVVLLIGAVVALLIVRTINNPLKALARTSARVGAGDYTVNIPAGADDAIGQLGDSLNDMIVKQREVIGNVVHSSQALAQSSADLSTISDKMVQNADSTAEIADVAASNTGDLADNMNSVSAAMEESTVNLSMIATAAEEMSATINEIAENSSRARVTTEKAVANARISRDNVAQLNEAATSIGVITETIAEISEQTNLLALNATIEAARAGGAGKGFAVVANEIKELAQQTADATGRIKDSIAHIQQQTNQAVGSISSFADIIDEVDQIVNSIVTAVDEQSVTTNEIVNNVTQASQGVVEINENVASSSQMTEEMTQHVGQVQQQSTTAKESSQRVRTSADDLSTLAENLTRLVACFKVDA